MKTIDKRLGIAVTAQLCLALYCASAFACSVHHECALPQAPGSGHRSKRAQAPILATANVRSASFTAKHVSMLHGDLSETPPTLDMHVQAMRPAFLRIDAVSKPVITTSPNGRSISYTSHGSVSDLTVSNSAGLFENVPHNRTVIHHNPLKRLEEIPPYMELSDRARIHTLFGGSLADFRRVGTVNVSGRAAVLYRPASKDPDVMDQYEIYVDPKTRLPIRISRIDYDEQGKRVEIDRADYSDWKLNSEVDPTVFQFKPPVGSTIKEAPPKRPWITK